MSVDSHRAFSRASLAFPSQDGSLWDQQLIERYDLIGPRYTSYPTALQFSTGFDLEALHAAVARSNATGSPLSLYLHIPFCSRVCYYCGCNRIVTARRAVAVPYLQRLEREMAMMSGLMDATRPVRQLHWGGGTPTYLDDSQKRQLMAAIRSHFSLLDDDSGEYAIEVHPGDTTAASIACLRSLGFNRLSMGVQDFDPDVQRAVNRFNSIEEVAILMGEARAQGFHSIGMDLIYGLPYQTWPRFERTLAEVVALAPDRLSLFGYAHMPQRFKVQRQLDVSCMPTPAQKLEIFHRASDLLRDAGYVFIGMDHFARPGDELAVAQREGRLTRNFQGYATHGDCDLLAFGVSAISALGGAYFQNHKVLAAYNDAIDSGRLPLAQGLVLTGDDLIRGAVIRELICHFQLDFAAIERRFGIEFRGYFADELARLGSLAKDGLVQIEPEGIVVTARGRLLVRSVCMVFDAWLQPQRQSQSFSRII